MAAKETPQRSGFSGATRAAPFREPPFLWVELTRDSSLLFHDLCDLYPGHRISGHEDLRLAIEKLSPSFICFEHDHPGGDGIRLLAETSARYPYAPLVMLTNDHAKETMVLAYRSGASSYVVKPIALHELVREIRMLLALGRDHAQFPAGPPATGLPSQPEGACAGGPDHTVSRTAAALVRLEQGFADDLRLEDLAMACHMSGSHFSRTFKKEHGTSFRRYLLRYRLERACELLAMAETSVKQAALAAGFNDCSYFGRVFRRRYGMTPRDYQAQHSAPHPEHAPGGARS
ncbi:MAG: helix-turn-helix domain-containing protein [Pseudomonadota bacterium]|nr:helix-turn-helix domain-containing protein [Pseudomonadota bacterium]